MDSVQYKEMSSAFHDNLHNLHKNISCWLRILLSAGGIMDSVQRKEVSSAILQSRLTEHIERIDTEQVRIGCVDALCGSLMVLAKLVQG